VDEDRRSLFTTLDSSGRFRRDNAVGRLFHRGTASFREIGAGDSLHVAVSRDNRISVHVDRVSPLCLREGSRVRYSVARAIVHNAVFLLEAAGRLLGRRCGHHRCELQCEVVWVDDDAA
jgi:hypothetical protein